MSDRTFDDRVVWITGASAGIGQALALAFADAGAHVAVSARREDRLRALVDRIGQRGRKGLALPCDVLVPEQIDRAVEALIAHFGRLDVAVANAGFGVYGKLEHIGADEWQRQLGVNVTGVAMTARAALPHLRNTRGRLALVGSVASMMPSPMTGPYAASKAAVRSMGQTFAVELAGSGVSCTTLHPGFVESEIGRVDNAGRFHAERLDQRPGKLMWPTDRAARVMLRAIRRRKRDYVFTVHGRIAGFLGQHCPWVLRRLMIGRGRGA